MPATPNLKDNRLTFFVGLNTGYVTNGKPDARFIEFYRRRSSPALHCAIVGNVVIPGGHGTNPNTAQISRAREWTDAANAIAGRGSLPGIQFATTWEQYNAPKLFRAAVPRVVIQRLRDLVRQLGQSKVMSTLASIDTATDFALEAGFRHLQIHAAHGYLFSLLVDDRLNDCADDVRNWLGKWALRQSSRGIETSIRISLRTGDPEFDAVGRNKFYTQIATLPFDFIDVSSGFYDINKQLIYPGRQDIIQQRRAETIELALRFGNQRFIFSGRALLEPDEDLPPNVHFGIGRDLLANADYLTDKSRGCVNSGKCHYFSRGFDHVSCSQWQLGPEYN
jgi:NADPH2 dehydrogenase